MLNRKNIFWITGVAAASVRVVFYALFAGTMFHHYHKVSGLDMQTLLRFSEWGTNEIPPFFTLHRVLLYLIWRFNDFKHSVDLVFLIQSLTAIAAAVALSDLVLMLTGRRKAALASGVIYAVYLPFLIYEFSILQESLNVNIQLFALWALFRARKKRFSAGSSITAGIFWGLALTGRPVSLILAMGAAVWMLLYARKKNLVKKSLTVILSSLLVVLAAAGFNLKFNGRFSPFYNVLPYTLQYNTGVSSAVSGAGKNHAMLTTAKNMLSRTPQLFSIREIPENQNLYFWREKLPESRLLPGPELLLFITIFSILTIVLSSRWKYKEGLLLWVPLLLGPPLCGREAIGRYRLMLCPVFIALAMIGFTCIKRISPKLKRRIIFFTALAVTIAAVVYDSNLNRGLRSSDFHAWAAATEAVYGIEDSRTLDAYYDCWQRTGFSNALAFRSIAGAALRSKRYDLAQKVINQARITGNVNISQIAYFEGLIYVDLQDPERVLRAFAPIVAEDLPPDLQKFYFRVKSDAERFLKNRRRMLNKTP